MRKAMKKLINKTALLVLAVLLVSACSSDPELFDKSDSFVAFNSDVAKVSEKDSLMIPVDVGALKGSPSVTVNFEVVDSTGATIAKEGVDFTLGSTSITFVDGFGTQYVKVKPVDNDLFTGNKTFKITLTSNSVGYPFGVIQTVNVTIVDDEHPSQKLDWKL